jgi:hypothetical protein
VSLPPGEDAFVQRAHRARGLPLLRLRGGGRRLQVRDAPRADELPGSGGDAGPPLLDPRARVALRGGGRSQGARGDPRGHGGGRRALHADAVDGAGYQGPRVPPRPRLPEGDPRAHRRGSRARFLGRPPERPAPEVPGARAADRRPRPRPPGQERPLRPLPEPSGVPHRERVRQGRGFRRALPRRQRAQVPELSRDPGLPEEPHPLRPPLGQGGDAARTGRRC